MGKIEDNIGIATMKEGLVARVEDLQATTRPEYTCAGVIC